VGNRVVAGPVHTFVREVFRPEKGRNHDA
jgi:hypothetical protein